MTARRISRQGSGPAPGGKEVLKKATVHALQAGPLKDAKHVLTCAHEIIEAMEKLQHLEHQAHAGAHVAGHLAKKAEELEKLVKAGKGPADAVEKLSSLKKARDWIAGLDKTGRFSLFYVGASVLYLAHGAARTACPRTSMPGGARARPAYMLASSEGLAKLFYGAEGVEKLGRVTTALKALKVLGPIADGFGAYLDFRAAAKYSEKGDPGRAWGYGVSGAGSSAMAVGGILLFTPAAPVGAVVLVVGAVVTGIGMGIRYFGGNTDEAQFLYDLGKDFSGGKDKRLFYTP